MMMYYTLTQYTHTNSNDDAIVNGSARSIILREKYCNVMKHAGWKRFLSNPFQILPDQKKYYIANPPILMQAGQQSDPLETRCYLFILIAKIAVNIVPFIIGTVVVFLITIFFDNTISYFQR